MLNRVNKKMNKSWQDTLTKSIVYAALDNIENMTKEDLIKLRESFRPTEI